MLVTLYWKAIIKHRHVGLVFTHAAITVLWWKCVATESQLLLILGVLTLSHAALAIYKHLKKTSAYTAFFASVTTLSLMTIILEATQSDVGLMFLLIDGALAAALGWKIKNIYQMITGFVVYGVTTLYVLENSVIEDVLSIETATWLVLILSLFFLKRVYKHYTFVALSAAAILIFISELTLAITDQYTLMIQQMTLSFVWAVFSVLLILYGQIKKDKWLRWFGMGFIFVTLLKLIFVDLSILSVALRAVLFIVIGFIGVIISRLLYKKEK